MCTYMFYTHTCVAYIYVDVPKLDALLVCFWQDLAPSDSMRALWSAL